jgi:RNA polymerase-binding transcription factor DksA
MTPEKTRQYRGKLEELNRRIQAVAQSLEEVTRTPTGGEAAGNLSNTPMHLADIGTEVYTQELNSALLENEEFIRQEVIDALGRIDAGMFGKCEQCGRDIPEGRLEALPYARYCVPCAEKLEAGADVNLNEGRPAGWGSTLDRPAKLARQRRAGEQSPTTAPRPESAEEEDPHAVGTPGGGTAVGGLAGTNIGDGEPDDELLDYAMGSSEFDVVEDADEPGKDDAYAGPSGGAVGGTPANKRAVGGHMHGGINPATDKEGAQ